MTAPSRGSQLALSVPCTHSYTHTHTLHLNMFIFPRIFTVLFFLYPSVKGQKVKWSDDSCLLKPFTPVFTGYLMHMWVFKCSHVCLVQSRSLLRLYLAKNYSIFPFLSIPLWVALAASSMRSIRTTSFSSSFCSVISKQCFQGVIRISPPQQPERRLKLTWQRNVN